LPAQDQQRRQPHNNKNRNNDTNTKEHMSAMPPKEETRRLLREASSALTESSEGIVMVPPTATKSPPRWAPWYGAAEKDDENDDDANEPNKGRPERSWSVTLLVGCAVALTGYILVVVVPSSWSTSHDGRLGRKTTNSTSSSSSSQPQQPPPHTTLPSGPYRLFQLQDADNFLDHYEFYVGEDSVGSAGYNTYVTKDTAVEHKLVEAVGSSSITERSFVIRSAPGSDVGGGTTGPRQSIRLEGTTRFNSGLFIVDLRHMPAGCGVWPAVWLTDEQYWPNHGEIDFIEGVNYQNSVKTALHTSAFCDMYAHVDLTKQMTGIWDRATGIPDTFTGQLDTETNLPADNCWTGAPHQWANQGCVIESQRPGTLGPDLNAAGGAVFVLEWDPRFAIRSWVYLNGVDELPPNLAAVLDDGRGKITPEPDTWGAPYAYFAIGDGSGCSADHFVDMRLVINTAFCGTVAGNRFFTDCHVTPAHSLDKNHNPISACNAYIATDPPEMDEAYWELNSIRVYQRSDA
jgi:hypothetical protein